MASIRQIFMLYIFVALLCHFGDSYSLRRGPVGKLNKLPKNVFDYLLLKYQRLYNPKRFAHLKPDIDYFDVFPTPWDNFDDLYYNKYREVDDNLSNFIKYYDKYYIRSKDYHVNNLSNEAYDIKKKDEAKNDDGFKNLLKSAFHKYEERKTKPNHRPKEPKKTNINNEKPNLLDIYSNPALYDMNVFPFTSLSPPYLVLYLSNPAVPKTNSHPMFVSNNERFFSRNVQNNNAPHTRQPNNIFGNLMPEINNLPVSDIPNRNFGYKPVSNSAPTGSFNNNNPESYPGQQMYYWIQLSNGQVVLVPGQALFAPNNGHNLGPGYVPIFLPNNKQIFAPGQNLLPIHYNDYMSSFIYGNRYVPGRNLPRPRIVGVFPGSHQTVPHYNGPDYLKLPKDILGGMAANGKPGVKHNDQGISFIDQDMWRFGDFETYNSSVFDDAVFLSTFKDKAKLSSPENKNKEVDAKESKNKDDKNKEFIIYA